MSRPLGRMQSTNKRFTRAIRRDFAQAQRSVDRFGRNLNKSVGRAASRAVAGGFIAIGAGVAIATKEFIEFDQTIVGATARFKDLEIGTAKTAATMVELKKTAREVGAVTQFTATESAAGLNFFAKAGFTSVEAMKALKTQVDLATVAELDLARTSDITSDLLGGFGLNVADSATKVDNLAKLTNSLGLAANLANVTLEDMFDTLKIAAPIATAAGEDMNTLIAITAALGSAGIKGSQGATAIKNSYLNLAANAPKVQKALKGIGLAQEDFVNQLDGSLDMVKAMKLIGDATKDIGKIEQVKVFEQIFGKFAIAGAVNISKSLSEIDQIIKALDSDKNIADIADQIRTGLGMQIKILRSGLLELGFKFVEAFETQGRGALSGLITAVQNFDMQPIIDGVKTAFNIFSKFIEIVSPFAPLILSLIVAFKAYKIIMIAVAAAQAIFNGAMTANPIGIITIAIWGLIKALDELEKRFGFGQKIVDEFGGGVGSAEFNIGRRERLAERQAAAALTDPRRQRLAEREEAQAPISPAERSALVREESVSRGEVTIRDETGRAEMTETPRGGGFNLNLVQSGEF